MCNHKKTSRRDFIQKSAMAGAGLALLPSMELFSQTFDNQNNRKMKNIKSKGYAATDTSGKLSPWEFERRPVGDNDILIDIKYASICHSDIHTMKGDWGKQIYPQVPGHEIVGIVSAVGKKVTKFKVGDRAGVGCIVGSCLECEPCKHGEEQFCEKGMLGTYGNPDQREPSGITQGGYSTNIVIHEHFAVHIPENISFQEAAPLLCAGITTYSPIMKYKIKKGDKVGVVGIGGLGHMAVKLAIAKGAEVYAFTTSPEKVADIKAFGVKDVIVVDEKFQSLNKYRGTLDYVIATVPVQFDVAAYANLVKPFGYFTLVGMGVNFDITMNNLAMSVNRVNFNASLIGGIPETQEVVDFCAKNKIYPQIQIIKANQINDAWENVINKKARFRYVIDAATF